MTVEKKTAPAGTRGSDDYQYGNNLLEEYIRELPRDRREEIYEARRNASHAQTKEDGYEYVCVPNVERNDFGHITYRRVRPPGDGWEVFNGEPDKWTEWRRPLKAWGA